MRQCELCPDKVYKRPNRKNSYRRTCSSCRNMLNKFGKEAIELIKQRAITTQCPRCQYPIVDRVQLHIDHKNGDSRDNTVDNLEIMCANCHMLKTKINNDYKRNT